MDSVLKDILENVPYKARVDCPYCNGIKTLSITNEDGRVLYNCFKASCTLKANGYDLIPSVDQIKNRLRKVKVVLDTFKIPEHFILGISNNKCYEMLKNWHCLEAYEKGLFKCAYDPRLDRFIFFVQDSVGNIIGAIGRALRKNVFPKVWEYEGSAIAPFLVGTGKTLILVEDCFSAIASTRIPGYVGMALLGTFMKKEYIPYIMDFDNILIALDPDAKNKAIELKNLLTYYKSSVKLWFIQDDIKNLSNEKLTQEGNTLL